MPPSRRTRNAKRSDSTPILNSLRGVLKAADPEIYKRYLVAKYGGKTVRPRINANER